MRLKSKTSFLLFMAIMFIASFAYISPANTAENDDKAVVRSILDRTGLKDMTVENVAEFGRDGRVLVLNLNKRGIDGVAINAFPREIFKLTALKGLFLKGNALTELPEDIGTLTELVELNLADNIELGKLPPSIGSLKSLKKLDIRYCGLTELPQEIGNLKNLESLQMWGNGFIELPYRITELTNLKELYLKNNKLTNIPYDMIKMDNLKYIDVQLNYLCSLLPEIDAWLASRDRRYKDHQYCDNVKK